MAGDWIKIEHWTPDKPEIFRIADTLGIDPDAVIGKLIRIWIWADQQTLDGYAGSVTESLLDRIASVIGFAKAIKDAGWLTESTDGLTFVNFDRHNGETAKQRALAAKRMQKHRREMQRKCYDGSVTSPSLKRREEKSNNNKKPPTPKKPNFNPLAIDLPFPSEAFRDAWQMWCRHRQEIRKPLKESQALAQIKKLKAMGEARAIATINHSIAGGWQGLFEPDAKTQPAVDPHPVRSPIVKPYEEPKWDDLSRREKWAWVQQYPNNEKIKARYIKDYGCLQFK